MPKSTEFIGDGPPPANDRGSRVVISLLRDRTQRITGMTLND